MIEPFLVVVCRYHCFLQPFEDLRQGRTKSSKALFQRYTSLPPQLALILAARNRHFRLASLGLVAILANVLTIALSGIFVIRETTIPSDFDIMQIYSPIVNSSVIDSSNDIEGVGGPIPGTNGEPFQFLLSNLSASTPLPPWTTKDRYYLPVELETPLPSQSNFAFTTIGFEGSVACTILTETPSNFTYDFSLNSDATQVRFLTTRTHSNGTKVDCFAPMSMTDDTVRLADGNHPNTQIFVSGNSSGRNAFEMFMVPMTRRSVGDEQFRLSCSDHFVGVWVRANISLSDKLSIVNTPASTENLGLITGPTANTSSVSLDKLVLACEPRTHAAKYNVTVDSIGQVLDAVEVPNSSFPMDSTVSEGVLNKLRRTFSYPSDLLTWHNDTRAREWLSFFVAKIAHSDSLLDPTAPLLDGVDLGQQVSDMIQRLFALILAGNEDSFIKLPEPVKVTSQRLTVVNRVFVSSVMYKIALVILCIDILVILNIYLRMPKPFLPRMPTSIASNVAFFAASHFAHELAEEAETCTAPEELVDRLKNTDRRFGFGKFIGTDGQVHTGIEREPFVHLLRNSEVTRRRFMWKLWQS